MLLFMLVVRSSSGYAEIGCHGSAKASMSV